MEPDSALLTFTLTGIIFTQRIYEIPCKKLVRDIFSGKHIYPTNETLISGLTLNDDKYDKELETLRRRRLEELKASNARETHNTEYKEELKMSETGIDWPDKPVDVSDGDFKEFIGKYPYVIVDCWAPWCGPCRMVGPVVEELAGDYKGRIAFAKLNTDENQAIAMTYGIMSIPTLLFFKNGELIDKSIGAMPKAALEPKVQSHL